MRFICVLGLLAGCTLPVSEFGPVTTSTTGTTADTGTTAPVTTAGTTASSTTTGTTSETSSGAMFIAPDSEGLEGYCDVFIQDCPPGQKCAWTASEGSSYYDITTCVPLVRDPLPDGAPCNYHVDPMFDGIDECRSGAMCVEGQGEWDGQGTCVSLCKGSGEHPYCDPGAICIGGRSLWICESTCDPFTQDCPVGERCDLYGSATLCIFDWPDEPRVKIGEPCDWASQCELGATCIAAATPACVESSCCTPFCDLADPQAKCPLPGQQCLPPDDWGQSVQPSLGVCRTEVP